MKVLKKGAGPNWSMHAKCTGNGNGGGGCGAELLLEKGDVYETTSSALSETFYHKSFTCPDCGIMTDVTGNVPKWAMKS